ncbi:hypothetical protein [Pseudomonas putida]|uniref:hypothetical protein n=1 Tax=Pseudomonas putida TaxID=303 RepID=UPI000904432D|nr:hypothetical protein [Pseudomonas putida]APE99916.1 hypothetical protein BG030_18725 [Pseudomonas putida]
MSDQYVPTRAASDGDQDKLYVNQTTFAELGSLSLVNPQNVSVMLTLMSVVGSNGIVQVPQAALADHCKITLKELGKAIADLTALGAISSVQLSPERGDLFTCVVSPELVTTEKPE